MSRETVRTRCVDCGKRSQRVVRDEPDQEKPFGVCCGCGGRLVMAPKGAAVEERRSRQAARDFAHHHWTSASTEAQR